MSMLLKRKIQHLHHCLILLILLKNAHVSKLAALSVEKYYMALMETQLKYVGFMAPLVKKVPDPLA